MLGFSKVQSNKVLEKIIREEPDLSVEDMIKKALRLL
jgi:Holliday junction resolvasome RuvABC DNA-binding subunit